MTNELIITEKPSAAKKIAESLSEGGLSSKRMNTVPYYEIKRKGKNIFVVSAVGHLFTVAEKRKSFKYPVFDLEWKPSYLENKESAYTKKYADTIKALSSKISSFVVACDYDIEGEVIGHNVIRFICGQKDAQRMKFSTLTKPDLIDAYDSKSKSIDWGQAKAGETRHFLDWMYGINLSRALTLAIRKNKTYRTMSSGRVQGPALKLLADREKEIQSFKPEKYWRILLKGILKDTQIEAWHKKDIFNDEKDADLVMSKVKGHQGIVKDIDKRDSTRQPPTPFDLTTLQTEAYSLFGYSPKRTLDIAQDLYSKGYISYPRTSSQQLSPKLGFKKIISSLMKQKHYEGLGKIVLAGKMIPNNGTKTDPAHPAIYPTGIFPESIDSTKRKVYDLVVKRFFATFGEPAIRQTITATIDVNTELFIAKGTKTTYEGWHKLYAPYVRLKEEEFPKAEAGDAVKVKKIEKQEKETEPPKRFNQASIIKELEKRNLGTKATRAQIIENLFSREYVQGRSIEVTRLGMKTTETLSKYCPEIVQEDLTRSFEEDMEEIRENKKSPDDVLEKAKKELTKILKSFKQNEEKIGKELAESYIETEQEKSYVGKCPECKKGELHIMHSRKNHSRFIACNKYPECKTTFSIPDSGNVKGTDKICEACGYPMVEIKKTRQTKTVCINPSCKSKVPDDKFIRKEEKEIEKDIVEQECPKCKEGRLVVKHSIYGHFLACNRFPKCRYTQNLKDGPLKEDFKQKK